MENTNKTTAPAPVTAKSVSHLKKSVRVEFQTLSACVKAFCNIDNLTKEDKQTALHLGIKKGTNATERAKISEKIYLNTPYYYEDADGNRKPAEKRTKRDAEGNKVTYYVPREKWSFAKIADCIRIATGDAKAEKVVVAQ